jgi:hypothetical protein
MGFGSSGRGNQTARYLKMIHGFIRMCDPRYDMSAFSLVIFDI